VFVWQGDAIAGGRRPLASERVPGNASHGSVDVGGLALMPNTGYIVGYAVGPDVSSVAATVQIPGDGAGQAFATTIDAQQVGPTFVVADFATPHGNNPEASGQWVGVFQGEFSYAASPVARADVPSSQSQGSIVLPGQLLSGATYTLCYFMGPDQKTRAAACTFRT
jgi:hypothetical protein